MDENSAPAIFSTRPGALALKDPEGKVTTKKKIPAISDGTNLKVDLNKRMVSVVGTVRWDLALKAATRVLGRAITDLDKDFGISLWRRMRRDPQLEAALTLLVASVLYDDITYEEAITNPDDPDYELGVEIRNFCQDDLEHLEVPFIDVLAELCLALAYGFKVAEQTYEVIDLGDGKGPMLHLQSILTKPQEAIAFIVDNANSVLALLDTNGAGWPSYTSILTGQTYVDYSNPNIIPRDKFVIATWRGENNDPRGMSIFAAAYSPWWFKGQVIKAYMQFLARFAQPSIVGTTPEGAQPDYIDDPLTGDPIPTDTPEDKMVEQLEDIQSGGIGAFPFGSTVNLLQATTEGAVFIQALGFQNNEMVQTVLLQALATQDSKFMARAASETHQDILGVLIRYIKSWLARIIKQDVLTPLVRYNYGDKVVRRLVPNIKMGKVEHQDFQSYADAIGSLYSSGYIDDDQLPGYDNILGGPRRDMAAHMAKVQEEKDMKQQQQPVVGGGITNGK